MESWPVRTPERELTTEEIATNLERARGLMRERELDALLVTSSDRFLNEYTPREDNHRFELTGFTGSTALVLLPLEDRARLYVDGRYHIQADAEVDASLVEVVKVPFGQTITDALFEDLADFDRPGYEGDRLSLRFARKIHDAEPDAQRLDDDALGKALGRPAHVPTKAIRSVPTDLFDRKPKDKIALLFEDIDEPEETAILVTGLDDIAWLTDMRGYHFLYQSSFAARALVTNEKILVLLEPEQQGAAPTELPDGVEFMVGRLREAMQREDMKRPVLQIDPGQVTAALLAEAKTANNELEVVEESSPVVAAKALKTPAELRHMESANERSARAIAKTVRRVRQSFAANETLTEADFYEIANSNYAEEGAIDLSFHTISGVGANSAIIHFSDPSADVVAKQDDLMLLDSGALYEGGMATDITRAFIAGGPLAEPSAEQKRLYTTVLRGLLRGMLAIFPEGSRGGFLDALVRAPLYEQGIDYAHGTGHGVGIHVHEPGVGISPGVTMPIKAGHVSSIEPGVYVEDFGGIRHENVCVFEPHPDHEGSLKSRPLNYVGFDTYLVDESLMEPKELALYRSYQAECVKRGTQLE